MVKTRFAPSPTGFVHIGGIRTALYCYLFARKNQGTFLLRVEDTDQERLVEWSVENLLSVLDAYGLTPDEGPHKDGGNGPYYQSQRLPIYQKYLHGLVENGHAYYCFCSSERLSELHEQQESLKLPTRYDGHCRDLPLEDGKFRIQNGESYTIRLKVPKGEKIEFHDLIRGRLEWNSSEVDDQILLKSDGFPTYHGAIVIDDHLMGVTHAFRGEEWISSIPKQVLTARALGMKLPEFAHMANILGADGKKLSKRTGDTAAEQFLEKGYLPEALVNFIAFLGWNPKTTQEIFSMDELIAAFDISGMNKAGAILDPVKLDWMNAQYISKMEDEELLVRIDKHLSHYDKNFYDSTFAPAGKDFNLRVVHELKTRLKRLDEFKSLTAFMYGDAAHRPDLLVNPKMKIEDIAMAKKGIEFGLAYLDEQSDVSDYEAFKSGLLTRIAEGGWKNGQILWPLRVALSGEEFSPGAFELVHILWLDVSRRRIRAMLEKISEES